MSKKVVVVLLLFLIVVSSLFASSLTYAYGNSFSSADIEKTNRGACYKDENRNIFQVSQIRDGITEFELVRKVAPINAGSEIYKRGPLFFIGLTGGLKKASASVSALGFLYPVSLTASFDYCYDGRMFAFAGIRTEVPLSIVMESDFSMVLNGSAFAYAMGGTKISDTFSFATKWGLGYRHILGSFYWSVGFDEVWQLSDESKVKDLAVSVGVML